MGPQGQELHGGILAAVATAVPGPLPPTPWRRLEFLAGGAEPGGGRGTGRGLPPPRASPDSTASPLWSFTPLVQPRFRRPGRSSRASSSDRARRHNHEPTPHLGTGPGRPHAGVPLGRSKSGRRGGRSARRGGLAPSWATSSAAATEPFWEADWAEPQGRPSPPIATGVPGMWGPATLTIRLPAGLARPARAVPRVWPCRVAAGSRPHPPSVAIRGTNWR